MMPNISTWIANNLKPQMYLIAIGKNILKSFCVLILKENPTILYFS